MKKNILFVCVENANRSQIAQAFAKIYGEEKVNSYSAGSKPSGKVNEKAIQSMKELGYNLGVHQSKSLSEIPDIIYDYVVTMGCGDECPYIQTVHRMDWQIPDPRHMEPNEFNKVRDFIAEQVKALLKNI